MHPYHPTGWWNNIHDMPCASCPLPGCWPWPPLWCDELVAAGEEVTVADRDGYSPRTQMVLDRAREMADRFTFVPIIH